MYKNILLIDDDIDEYDLFFEALSRAKLKINLEHRSSVKEGLGYLEKVIPDFIFLDMNMPKMSGLEGLTMLKANTATNHIPVIMYSNGMDDKLCGQAIGKGASSCLKKMIMIKDLSSALKKILGTALPVTTAQLQS